jgi:Uncharacterized protein conserved in bacteria
MIDECEVEFSHHMAVTRIYESPRVTKPYTDDQWQAVLTLGEVVDQQLKSGDVRLTQGGEPTFVATTDRDAPEWNTDAQGPTKRGYAGELISKLIARYGPGGFLHFGQGKWYPGEQLPRWALSAIWRRDGQPCWHNPELFADERLGGSATALDAHTFILALVDTLGVNPAHVQTGFEDTWYYLWRERRLPVNVDPFDSRVEDELERARLRKVFDQGLKTPTGYALPIRREPGSPQLSGRAGSPARGSSATSACICSPATRPWAGGCRSTRCPGPPRATAPPTGARPLRPAQRPARRRRAAAAIRPDAPHWGRLRRRRHRWRAKPGP